MASREVGESVKLRVFLIPYYATGHIIPMFQLARLMAARGDVEPTILLTPANAAIIQPLPSSDVRLLLYPFPSAQLGLPAGIENIASVSLSDTWKIDKAIGLVRQVLDPIIRDQHPDAIVADVHHWWALLTARDHGIPGISFSPIGVFPQLVLKRTHEIAGGIGDGHFTVPDLPGPPIQIDTSELPEYIRSRHSHRDDKFAGPYEKILEAQLLRFGVLVNTFYELEPAYCDLYRTENYNHRAWFVGPVALAHANMDLVAAENVEKNSCMGWLEAHKARSVVFVCFGSWCHFADEQLREMALGLEASGQAFLWVVRIGDTAAWMPEGWERRVDGRGMVVKGWAPQVAILNHPAVGAFMTHCGWNSVLEATAAGVPMLTWPLVFEQFINERLVVGVMAAGARVWNGFRSTEDSEKLVVPAEAIGGAVSTFMKDGGAGEVARRRAQEYAALAKMAINEGGSSHRDLNGLIDDLMSTKSTKGGSA